MGYVPYKLLNRSELTHIEVAVKAACRGWVDTWLGEDEDCEVTCHRSADCQGTLLAPEMRWLVVGTTVEQQAAIVCEPEFLARFGARLLAIESAGGAVAEVAGSPLLADVALSATTSLLNAVAADDGAMAISATRSSGLSPEFLRQGSGAAIAQIDCGVTRFFVALGPQRVAGILSTMEYGVTRRAVLTKIVDALSNQRLQLHVLAGEAQLELGLLQTIVVGDVIKLDTRVDQPLRVVNGESGRVCNAYLGTQQGRKSIQLTK